MRLNQIAGMSFDQPRWTESPDDNGTEGPVLDVLSVGDSEKVDGINGVAPLNGGVNQVVNEGTDSVPHLVEWRTMNWMPAMAKKGFY